MVQLLNEQTLPSEDITEEVKAEAEEHQFFFLAYELTGAISTDLNVTYTDQDANGNPIGVSTLLKTETGDATLKALSIILRHEPNKFAVGVSNGDPTNAGGETDIEVVFKVVIQ